MERRRLVYSGHVQGVGFRARAQRLATAFPIAGWVRNLPDGDVELVVEGEPMAVRDYLKAVRNELGSYIRGVHDDLDPSEGSLPAGFVIRY